jgi:hypothetical protein
MWVFLNNSFFSAVVDKNNDNRLVVRARVKGDLERTFGEKTKVVETTDTDYRFRCFISKAHMKYVMCRQIENIDYTNFKNSVDDKERHDHYLEVWCVMNEYQENHYPRESWEEYFESKYGKEALLGE